MSDDTTKDTLSRYIAIAGVLLSTAALGVSVWTAASGELRQKQIDDIQIQQANDRAFDLLGGTHGALWVHATKATGTDRARFEEARRVLDNDVLIRRPQDPRGLELKGIYLAKIGRLEDAIQQFRLVTKSAPGYYKGFCSLATSLLQAQTPSLDAADAAVSQCLALEPNYALGHNLRGSIHDKKRDFAGAETSYRRAIELEPTYAAAYTNLAGTLHEVGRHDEEEKWNRMAIDVDSSFGPAHYNLALALREQRRRKEADVELKKALELGVVPQ